MEPLLTVAQAQAADQYAIQTLKIPSDKLMEAAARAACAVIQDTITDKSSLGVVLAGIGNNGGDAFAVARLLRAAGFGNFTVHLMGKPDALSKDAGIQKERWEAAGGTTALGVSELHRGSIQWAVDGLFGVGLKREVSGAYLDVIQQLNAADIPNVFALDVPSGLNADTGAIWGAAVRASHTICFGFLKQGLLTADAASVTGSLHLDTIGIPREIPSLQPECFWFDTEAAKKTLPVRSSTGHKGSFGHVYVWIGESATEGAAGLATLGAYRSGCGLVSLISDHALGALQERLPLEVMAREVDPAFLSTLSARDVLVIGPGLGTKPSVWETVQLALGSSARLVLDADALNLIAEHPAQARAMLGARSQTTVLTPHPKEAARLLDVEVDAITKDRFQAIRDLAAQYAAHIVLKGKGTLIVGPQSPVYVVTRGNSALAKGGTGDVLSGILGALVAQSGEPTLLAALGVFVHGRSAERLAKRVGTERAALASEFTSELGGVWAELE